MEEALKAQGLTRFDHSGAARETRRMLRSFANAMAYPKECTASVKAMAIR